VAISGLAVAMLDFPLPVTLWDVTSSLIELGYHKNMAIAVGISSLSGLRADILLFPVWRPPFWISHFRLCCGMSLVV
jgi:hypothetical protein